MYDRFTERARTVMRLAESVAGEWCHEYLGTEHLMLGILKERSNVAANVLADLGLFDRVLSDLTKTLNKGPDIVTMGRLPATPRLKKAIDKAYVWVTKLKHLYVGSEHLLLGLLDDPESVATAVITSSGLTAEAVQKRCLEFLGHEKLSEDPPVKRGGLRIASITPCLLALAEGKWVRVINDQLEIRDEIDRQNTRA
ncbi:MAG: Clp protease N-terminal domain-containing protein [Planctomycetota bacterium]